jgi:hypothetical protein
VKERGIPRGTIEGRIMFSIVGAVTTVSFWHLLVLLALLVCAMLIAGTIIVVSRARRGAMFSARQW